MTKTGGARAAAKRATREALIEAAYAEISEHGPQKPSLDAICARAGKTRGAFYVHFRDREELLLAVMERMFGDVLGALADAAAGTDSGGLEAGIRTFAAAAASRHPAVHPDRALRFHHVLEACRTSVVIGERYRSILGAAAAWAQHALEDDQRRGRARDDVEPGAAAQLVLASALGLLAMLELGIAGDPEALGETLVTLFSPASCGSAATTG